MEDHLATVRSEIIATFFAKLEDSQALDADTLAELRELFQAGKKLTADDVVTVISKVRGDAKQ